MSEPRIYIGPTLAKWGLSFGQVFSGDLPEYVAKATERSRALSALIVPVSQTVSAREQAGRKGTLLNSRRSQLLADYKSFMEA